MRNFLGVIVVAIGAFLFSLGYIVMDDEGKEMFVEKFAQRIYELIKDDLPEFADIMAAQKDNASWNTKSAP